MHLKAMKGMIQSPVKIKYQTETTHIMTARLKLTSRQLILI